MKKIYFKYFLCFFFFLFLLAPQRVFAKDRINLTANKETLEVGDEVLITASIKTDEKLYAMTASLSYDQNVFAPLDESNFSTMDDTSSIFFQKDTNKFGIINKTGESDKSLFTVSLTAKKDAKVGDTLVGLSNISFSSGEKKTTLKKTSVKLLVTRDAKDGEEVPINKPNVVKDSKEKTIKTISFHSIIIGLVIGIIILLLVLLMTRKEKGKWNLILRFLLVFFFLFLLIFLFVREDKKDVNQDGKKNYQDGEEIIKYLIDIKNEEEAEDEQIEQDDHFISSSTITNIKSNSYQTKTSKKKQTSSKKKIDIVEVVEEENPNRYDSNGDGKVDIEDVGDLVQDETENTNYKVTLSEKAKEDVYLPKGEVTLHFTAVVTPNEKIKEIMIDGVYYPAIYNGTYYSVTLKTPNKAGVHVFKATKVKLENNREIKVNLSLKKEILKDVPYVDLFYIDDENNTVNFVLEDKDKAFLEGNIVILDEKGEEVVKEEVKKENKIHHEFEKDKTYQIIVRASYDLDSNQLNDITGEQNKVEDKTIYEHTFMVTSDYDFKIENVQITDAISKGEKLVLSFDSTNLTEFNVESIVVDGVEYKVSKVNGDHYEVLLDKRDTSKFGKYQLQLDAVILSNLKEFQNEKDFTVPSFTYHVLKEVPKIDSIKLKENSDDSITASYQFYDKDQTLLKLSAVLVDSTDKVLEKKEEIKVGDSVTLSYQGNMDGRYKVKFLADYDLGTDRHIYTEKNIGEEEIVTQSEIFIESVQVDTYFPKKKQQKYTIKYKANVSDQIKESTKYNELAGVTINGLNYDGNKGNDFQTTISFTVPSESGVLDLKVERVKLRYETYQGVSSSFFSVPTHHTKIDVLKDIPNINNLSIDDDYEKKTATLSFDVEDDKGGFLSGYVTLDGKQQEITRGRNKVTFEDITPDQALTLAFYGDYDLDTNTLEGFKDEENQYHDTLLSSFSYGLYSSDVYDKIKVENLNAISQLGNTYFEKKEDVNVSFTMDGLDDALNLEVAKVIINKEEYMVTKEDNVYHATINGYYSYGQKDLVVEGILLQNGKKVMLKDPVKMKIEVLKTPVTMEDFHYEIKKDTIDLTFSLKDKDKSVVGDLKKEIQVKIYDEDDNKINQFDFDEKISIPRKDSVLRYYVKVYANYDLDIEKNNQQNEVSNALIYDTVISTDKNIILVNDILDVKLYQEENDTVTLRDQVNVDDILSQKENYFVELTIKDMPSIRLNIKSILQQNDHLILVLDSDTIRKKVGDGDFRIDFGPIKDKIAENQNKEETITDLIEKIKADPKQDITLTRDFDASTYQSTTDSLTGITYQGNFDGNGYTIRNLQKPLFDTIDGGSVKNVKLENVVLTTNNAKGALANSIKNTTLDGILLHGFTKATNEAYVGSLAGTVEDSTIKNSRSTSVKITTGHYYQNLGGLAGSVKRTTIQNCYVTGSIEGGWNFRGGLVGNSDSSTFEHNYTKVAIPNSGYGNTLVGGITCGGGNSIFKNNISLNTGNIPHKISSAYKTRENNFYVAPKEEEEVGQEGVKKIEEKEVKKELFETLGFSSKIWNLENASYQNPPTLISEKESSINPEDAGDLYDEKKEVLYYNLKLLMPYYSSKKIVEVANTIKGNSLLEKEKIKYLVPVDSTGNIVTYLTTEERDKIKRLKIVFQNNKRLEYSVTYDNTYDMVVSYRIKELKIDYTYKNYVINSNSQLINNLVNYLDQMTYQDNLDSLTTTADSRIYKDYYNDVTKKELKEFVLKYLASSNKTITTNTEAMSDYLEKELKKDKKLEKALYVYNYLRRFYSVSIDGMMLQDFMLFDFTYFNKNMTPDEIAANFLENEENLRLNGTNTTYERMFSKDTNYNTITDFLAYLVTGLTNKTPSEWYKSQFKGYIRELNIDGREDILYTLWDHISNKDMGTNAIWYNYALPIITLPKNAAYVISTPTEFVIGAQRTYVKNPDNSEEQKELQRRVDGYASRMKDYFTTASKLLEKAKYFNDIHTIQIDKRYTYDENGIVVFQNPESTEEPFHKNFNEVIGQWAYNDYNAATANGAYVIWRVEGLMDGDIENGSEYTYHTWSHETAHNIDARLFLKNNGRRFDAGGEDYADCNLMQAFNEGDIVMNFSRHFKGVNSNIASNLEPERIDSEKEIHDFYNKLFQTIYIMDYLEGRAFLKLNAEEQSKIAVQASYPNENKYTDTESEHLRYKYTVYQEIGEEKYKEMNLKSVGDLYDHNLVIFPGVIYSTYTDNRYGGENIYKVHWYQPHNDYGRPDSYSIKWFAYEMLGYKGYNDGYIEYFSNINSTPKVIYKDASDPSKGTTTANYKTDLMALRTITGNPSITFETYKKNRFQYVEDNLQNIQIIDVNKMFLAFYNALKEDAKKVKEVEQQAMEKYPNDVNARNKMISEQGKQFQNSKAVRKEIYYALKNGTNDFIGNVYDSKNPQIIEDFTVPEEEISLTSLEDDENFIIESEEEVDMNEFLLDEDDENFVMEEDPTEEKESTNNKEEITEKQEEIQEEKEEIMEEQQPQEDQKEEQEEQVVNESPIVKAIDQLEFELGDEIDYYSLITAEDKEDGILTISEENTTYQTEYDGNMPGNYKVVYQVTDSSSNTTTFELTITIKEKSLDEKETEEVPPLIENKEEENILSENEVLKRPVQIEDQNLQEEIVEVPDTQEDLSIALSLLGAFLFLFGICIVKEMSKTDCYEK